MVLPLALRTTQEGVIWARRPLISASGLLSSVRNVPFSSFDPRPSRFRDVAFNGTGDTFAAVDERGRVFVFFVTANRYALVQHLGVPTLACCFNPARKTELLVTCENDLAHCIDVQSQILISTLRGHRYPAKCASFHKSGKLALTASQDAVILWDTKDWSRYRVLNAGPGVEMATFVSKGDLVAVCFQDDTIMMWELETLALRYRFSLPEQEESPGLQTISVSDDYQVVVASGRAPFIYVWELESQTIIRIIELPSPVKEVVSHAFLPGNNRTISILGDDGGLYFLSVSAKRPKVKVEISSHGRQFKAFDIECHARYMAVCTSDGHLMLYDMEIARETAARAKANRTDGKRIGDVEMPAQPEAFDRHETNNPREKGRNESSLVTDPAPVGASSRPVPSKLIDSLFGSPHTRRKSPSTNTGAILSPKGVDERAEVAGERLGPQVVKARASRSTTLRSARAALSNPIEVEKNKSRLASSLKCSGSYPRKYRVLVWRFLLQLPKNEDAFLSLVKKGKHPSFAQLREHYPLKDERMFRRLHRILSALAYWCPAFGEVSYLPAIVYPFVKVFRENDLAAFEASMSVMLHWCKDYLFNLPHPPASILTVLRHEIERREPQLYSHFVMHNIGVEIYGWSLLQTVFTEVLNEDEWMCLWDHLFTYSDTPQLLVVVVLSYLAYFRGALLAAADRYSIEQFFHQQNAMDIHKFIQLLLNTSKRMDLSAFLTTDSMAAFEATGTTTEVPESDSPKSAKLWPLPVGQYPAFGRYPNLVVDFQISERKRIELEEAELGHKQLLLQKVRDESERLKREHAKWMEEKQLTLAAEEKRRKEAIAAEKARILELKSLDYTTRKARLELLQKMEESARQTLEESSKTMQAEHQRLGAMLSAQQERMEFEISSRRQEEDLQRIEFETEQRVLNIQRQRALEENLQRLRAEFATRAKQQEMEDLLKFTTWKREDEERRRKAKIELHQQEQQALRDQEQRLRQELEAQFLEQATAKEKEMLELEAQRHARQFEERQRSATHPSRQTPKKSDTSNEAAMSDHARRGKADDETSDSDDVAASAFPAHTPPRPQPSSEQYNRWKTRQSRYPTSREPVTPRQPPSGPGTTATNRSAINRDRSDRGRRLQFDSPLNASSASNDSSVASAAMQRTMEEMRLLEKALANISSSMSSHSSDADGKENQENANIERQPSRQASTSKSGVTSPRPSLRQSPSETQHDRLGSELSSQFDFPTEATPIAGPAHTRLSSDSHDEVSANFSHFDVDLEEQKVDGELRRHEQSDYDAERPRTAQSSDDVASKTDSELLQRPIAELEAKLGIRFDDLSDDDELSDAGGGAGPGSSSSSSSSSVDETIEDDRARLLSRAKKLLEEESFDSDSDDDGDGLE